MTCNHRIINYTSYIFIIFATTYCRIPNICFLYTHVRLDFYTHNNTQCYSTFDPSYIFFFLLSNIYSLFDVICFVSVPDSFISVVVLKTFSIKPSVFLGIHTILNIRQGFYIL